MYESFYGLKTKPFSMLPDPEFLYLGKKHQMALTLLEYGLMSQAGFCVISGETGAGKTTLLRKLLTSIGDDMTVGMITNTHQSFGELLDWILSAYGIHQPGLSKVEMHQRFVDFLLEQYANNKTALLIVDEAQNMPVAALEELRMLSNLNSDKDQVLQIILAGQPGLEETLRKPELTQFAQRIAVDYQLDTLDTKEACCYIQHRLVTAGATHDVFTPEACRLIHAYSRGIPRLINLLCDTALVYGFADQQETVGADLVEEMVKERMSHSVVPLINDGAVREQVEKSSDNIDFPWISPDGGTKGLKPENTTEKKTAETSKDTVKIPAEELVTAETGKSSTTTETTRVTEEPSQATKPDQASADNTETRHPTAAASSERADATEAQEETRSEDVPPAGDEPKDDRIEIFPDENVEIISEDETFQTGRHMTIIEPAPLLESRRKWFIAAVAAIAAVSLSILIGTYDFETELSAEVKSKLAEADRMKQELQRMQELQQQQYQLMQQQAATLQREQELARAKIEAQEKQHALDAAREEKKAIAAATIAAEKALQAARQAEKLAILQRREEERLRAERERLEQERRRAELEQQRLEVERREAELEIKRLEQARLKAEKATRQQWEEAAANEQAASIKKHQSSRSATSKTDKAPRKKETTFSIDPCSTPSAKFLSTCR